MMVSEWTDRTGHRPTTTEWGTITTVYAFHPAIPNVDGKDVLAAVYAAGGFGLIRDMEVVACYARSLESKRDAARTDMEAAAGELKALLAEYGR